LGGIGKTQTALAFVYLSRITSSRIFWVSGATQEALLDGYIEIAKRADIPILPDSKPIAVAQQVLSWLNSTPNWLLVIDNLDDINVLSTRNLGRQNIISTLLPESGSGHHTLVTTRNPNADNIPAQGMEVPLFDESESIDLLSLLSGVPTPPNSPEIELARQIVKELGYLPLAISQAAAYIKQVRRHFPNSSNFTLAIGHKSMDGFQMAHGRIPIPSPQRGSCHSMKFATKTLRRASYFNSSHF
jgi:hypothetical protein